MFYCDWLARFLLSDAIVVSWRSESEIFFPVSMTAILYLRQQKKIQSQITIIIYFLSSSYETKKSRPRGVPPLPRNISTVKFITIFPMYMDSNKNS